MEHLKNVFNGFGSIFANVGSRPKYRLDKNGFQQDRQNLQADINKVLSHLNHNAQKAYQHYGFETR